MDQTVRFAAPSAYGPDGFGALKRRGDAQLTWHDVEEKIFLAASEPQDFGREHRRAFDARSRLGAAAHRKLRDARGGHEPRMASQA